MNRLVKNIPGNYFPRTTGIFLALGALLATLLVGVPAVYAQDGPVIDVWYGLNQQFGIPGEPQRYCDIQGNVSDSDDVSLISYSLNGGPAVILTQGPDGRRLVSQNDFIIDLLVADLWVGANTIDITAVDGLSNASTETVTLTYTAGNTWPINYSTDWGSLVVDGDPLTPDPAILEQAHVVDGKWTVIGDSIRTVEPGYDRLIGIGELGWGDYEVEVPITIHDILNLDEFGAGLIFRWDGHTDDPHECVQPKCGWNPLGDIGWLFGTWSKSGVQLWDSGNDSTFTVQENVLYHLKMKVETNVLGPKYSLKVWEDGQLEPDYSSTLTDQRPDHQPMFGSLLLVAHQADVSFGNVTVVPITGPNDPPVAGDVAANAKFNGTTYGIDILFNDSDSDGAINPASVNIVNPPADGTIVSIDPVTGFVEYLHGGSANPTDTFTYTVEDNDREPSLPATVTLTIVPNELPVANDDAAFVKSGKTVVIPVALNDTDSDGYLNLGSVAIDTAPLHGTITAINLTTGEVTYSQNLTAAVADSFFYTIDDEDGGTSNIAKVVITIAPNVAPVAVDDAAIVKTGLSVDIDVPDNDIDSDGLLDLTSVVIVDNPLHGTIAAVNATTGVVTYDQDLGFAVADSFTYTIKDDDGETSNTATVVVTINPNVPPVANDDVAFVAFNSAQVIDVLANDTDNDGTIVPGTVSVETTPLHGITSVNLDGTITYTHTALTAEPDSFTYMVEDDNGEASNEAMVRLTVGAEPPEDFFSDDFNSCSLDPMWNFIDPLGDAPDPVIVGAFTGDAQVAISVPGGSTHQPYDNFLGAPYILQASQDKDFTLEVKFSSTLPDSAYALQGVIVRQDDLNWMRFDFYSNNDSQIMIYGSTNIKNDKFADDPIGIPGDSPLYLRIQRSGNDWDLYYKTDLIPWTFAGTKNYAMTVTGVGLFAGNADYPSNSAPPFTALVDYFSNSVDPIVEPDDMDDNEIIVTVSGLGSVGKSPDQATYACGDPVQLTATPDLDWVFTGWSGDLSGTDNPATIIMDRPRHVTANFAPTSGTVVLANTSGVPGISTGIPCATAVPIEILRDSADDIRGFTVTFGLTDLALCDGESSIIESDYLNSVSETSFNIIDNPDGTYRVEVAILGEPCGATALTGTLFTLDVTNTIANGTGTIDILDVTLRDCANADIPAAAGGSADILIDTTPPTGVTNLAFSKVMLDNAPGNVTAVDVNWTDSVDGDATNVSVFRKGFGSYPEYDDGGGSAPTLPADPIAEGWELVAIVPAGMETTTDLAPTRDYWYFCAQASDALGNQSTAIMTTGVLNYLLGDVSDGGVPILDGDNKVLTDDLTLLGAHYGTQDGQPMYLNNLDIGPTDDMSVNGLPATDNVIEFEDLMLFGINYGTDVAASAQIVPASSVPAPAPYNVLALHLPDIPAIGQTFEANLVLAGDGQIQGLKIPLTWDANVVEPIAIQGGQLLTEQGGSSLVLSATPGVVDVCLAGIRESGISGTGQIASVTFQVLASGNTMLQIADVDARDKTNGSVSVTTTGATPVGDGGNLPTVSALHDNYPNPFNPMTTIAFDLAVSGRVRIDIYSVDGRRIRTLIDDSYAAGRHSEVWNGRDQSGRSVASGTYFYTMEGPRIKQTRRMLLIK